MMAASASRPSVNADGPGCKMSGDLISRTKLSRTAGTSAKPGRAATLAGTNFLPHQEPTMMSGLAAINSSADTMRSLAFLRRESAGNTSSPCDVDELGDPADAGDHRLVPFLEIDP